MKDKEKQGSGKPSTKYTYKLRISQFIVLPTYQRLGIGSTLLESQYNYYLADKKCTEITVEDPSDDFQQMKDALDIKLIWKGGYFKSIRNIIAPKSQAKKQLSTKQPSVRTVSRVQKAGGPFINKDNFDQIVLDQEEILEM